MIWFLCSRLCCAVRLCLRMNCRCFPSSFEEREREREIDERRKNGWGSDHSQHTQRTEPPFVPHNKLFACGPSFSCNKSLSKRTDARCVAKTSGPAVRTSSGSRYSTRPYFVAVFFFLCLFSCRWCRDGWAAVDGTCWICACAYACMSCMYV
jgi:hypothetical protein